MMVETANSAYVKPGTLFADRYRIERLLGEGARKCTYLAEDLRVEDRLVALSLVKPEAAAADPAATKREANLLSRVGAHNHIVAFHDYDTNGPIPYLVFEYLSGGTLTDLIRRAAQQRETISSEAIVTYGRELSKALLQIHAAGVIHRDVAPGNVWLNQRQKAKLGDFDSAIRVDQAVSPPPITSETHCASPEEREGRPLEPRSDLYSLGALLISMALGEIRLDDFSALRERRNDLPPALLDLLASLVAVSPSDRPTDAEDCLQRLSQISRGTDIYSLVTAGEDARTEFKSSLRFPVDLPSNLSGEDCQRAIEQYPPKGEKAVLKTIAGFLNSEGGTLLVGVKPDGEVVGIEVDYETLPNGLPDRDGWQQYLREIVRNRLDPAAWSFLDISFASTRNGTVAAIRCPKRPTETWLKEEATYEFYSRSGSSTDQLPAPEAVRYIRSHWPS